jgi:uncharacterized protein YdcH (DUF465 family)
MAIEKVVDSLKKLYEKRNALDKQITDAENKLVEAAKLASKVSGQVKAVAAKKPAVKAAVKKVLKK